MNVFRKILGPKSMYDKTLPYTYEARMDVLRGMGEEPIYVYFYADTLCGLLDYLREKGIEPWEVELFEVYRGEERKIEKEYCVDETEHWLTRPEICHSLQGHYKGHIDEFRCSFRDRERQGCGPF